MSLRNKILNGVIWSAVRSIVQRGVTLAIFVILARLLDPESFGLVAIAGLFSVVGQEVARMGLASSIIQRADLDDEHINSAFWCVFALGVLLYSILYIGAQSFESMLDADGLADVLLWMGLGLVINAVSNIPEALLRRSMQFKQLAIRSIVGSAAGGVVGVFLAFQGAGVWSLVAKQLIEACVSAVMVWKASGWRPEFHFSLIHLKQLLPFGIHNLGISLLQLLSQHMDRFVIGVYMTPAVLGQYVIGKRLVLILQQVFNHTLSSVMFPALAKIQNDDERFRAMYLRTNRLIIFIACPIFTALILEGEQIIIWAFGVQWQEASQVARILGGVGLIQSYTFLAQPALKAKGFSNIAVKIGLARVMLDIILFYFLLPMGITGIAIAILCRAVIIVPVDLMAMRSAFSLQLSEYLNGVKTLVLGFFVFTAVVLLLDSKTGEYDSDILFTLLQLTISTAIYVALIYVIDRKLIRDVFSFRRGISQN